MFSGENVGWIGLGLGGSHAGTDMIRMTLDGSTGLIMIKDSYSASQTSITNDT